VFGNGPDWSGCLIAAAVGLLGALNKGKISPHSIFFAPT
jgi:hypothetical protein